MCLRKQPLIPSQQLARVLVLTGVLLHPAPAAQWQTPTPNTVVVHVTSDNGQPLERVRVEILLDTEQYVDGGFTDANGRLEFKGVPQAAYTFRAQKDGLRTTEVNYEVARKGFAQEVLIQMQALKSAGSAQPGGLTTVRTLSVPPPAAREFRKGLQLLNQKKNLKASIEHFQKAAAIYPGYFEAYFLMGMADLELNSPDDAQEAWRQAIHLNPKFIDPYRPLATLLIGKRQYQEGERLLLQARELDPNGWQWPFDLARSKAHQNQWDQALAYGKSALKMPNAPAKIHLLMADLYSNTGSPSQAIAEFEEFEKLEPSSPYIPRVQQAIGELRKRGPNP